MGDLSIIGMEDKDHLTRGDRDKIFTRLIGLVKGAIECKEFPFNKDVVTVHEVACFIAAASELGLPSVAAGKILEYLSSIPGGPVKWVKKPWGVGGQWVTIWVVRRSEWYLVGCMTGTKEEWKQKYPKPNWLPENIRSHEIRWELMRTNK